MKIRKSLAKSLLRKYSVPDGVLKHMEEVERIAVLIGKQLIAKGEEVDLDFLRAAAYLHDIGRYKINYESASKEKQALHASVGQEVLDKEGLPELAAIAGAHSVVEITKEEARGMGLPSATKLPDKIEAKIICVADKLRGERTEEAVENSFSRMWDRYFTNDPELGERVKKQTFDFVRELEEKGWDGKY
jgi:putative nucleotidyltransferase with HDIG domain